MNEFWVLFTNGDDKLATRFIVFAASIEVVWEKFPNATRVLSLET